MLVFTHYTLLIALQAAHLLLPVVRRKLSWISTFFVLKLVPAPRTKIILILAYKFGRKRVKSSYDLKNLRGPVKPRDLSWYLDPMRSDPLFGFQNKNSGLCSLRTIQCYSRQSLFSTDFLHSLFASRCSLFATFFLRLTARFSLLPFYYSLTFNRSSLLVGQFYFFAA